MRRIGAELGFEGFSQKRIRSFMADQTRTLFRMVPREQRSLMLGHTVKEASETTDYYESGDPWALADVALATDCIMTLLAERTERPLFAVDALLTRDQLEAIGARVMPKMFEKSGNLVGATGIEPVTPTMSRLRPRRKARKIRDL
jgi:hypothetical protein